jgi:Lecithin:cholesterol acyltransferase
MATLSRLVVVIPGIGGSILSTPNGSKRWGSTAAAARSIIWPDRVGLDMDLVPVGLHPSLVAFGPFHLIAGYKPIRNALARAFPKAALATAHSGAVPTGTRIIMFPYDFRRSISESADLLDRTIRGALEELDAPARRKRVVILAHSMGGLVGRYWAGPLGGWPLCDHLITFGTPHRGAPAALDWLVNGARVGGIRLSAATEEIRKWPSIYELLPIYPSVWDEAGSQALDLTRLPDRMTSANVELSSYGRDYAVRSAAARAVHDDIIKAWESIPEGLEPTVTTYFSRGHATPNRLELQSATGNLVAQKRDPEWRGNEGWQGDGTVPALSAIPIDLNERRHQWRHDILRHGDYAGMRLGVPQLLDICGDKPPVRGNIEDPLVTFDYEDVQFTHIPFRFSITVLSPALSQLSDVSRVRFSLFGQGVGLVAAGDMHSEGLQWSAVTEPLHQGVFELSVEAYSQGSTPVRGRASVVCAEPPQGAER